MTTRFRTLELSDPGLEPTGLRFVTVKSPALRARADLTLYVPAGMSDVAGADLPLVILLHGVYGSHWSWAFQGGVHLTAARLQGDGEIGPMVLAMPSDGLWGDGSGYLTHRDRDFERWIVEEVPAATARAVGRSHPWSGQFIAGLSMGGFGALRIGAKHPTLFQGISAHSPITHLDQMRRFVEEPLELYDVAPADRGVLEGILGAADRLPPLRFDCGVDDALVEQSRELDARLSEAGIPHRYEEREGGHDWSYWRTQVAESLRFFHDIRTAAHPVRP